MTTSDATGGAPRGPLEDEGLPESVRSIASEILERYEERKGRTAGERPIYEAGALSIAAEICRRPVPVAELAAGLRGDDAEREVRRAERTIAAELGIDALPTTPRSHVESYAEELGLPDETVERAREILQETYGDRDTAPSTAAAAAVYTASLFDGDHVSQMDVVEVADVSVTALKNAYRHQYDHVAGSHEGAAGD